MKLKHRSFIRLNNENSTNINCVFGNVQILKHEDGYYYLHSFNNHFYIKTLKERNKYKYELAAITDLRSLCNEYLNNHISFYLR